MEIVFATGNSHKLQEVNEIVRLLGYADKIKFILPPAEFSPEETGSTFEENSLIKAKEAHKLSNMPSLADDSGLCVEALDGAPGLYSARYAGTREEKINKLLFELKDKDNRNAKFVCSMTLLNKEGIKVFSTVGECKGAITTEIRGLNGFGYDPIFLVDGTKQTMAEMNEDDKNKISHRARALQNVINFIVNSNF